MKEFAFYTAIVALASAFIITLLGKWDVVEWVQVHGNEFFSQMFRCHFCLSFWTSVIISFALAFIAGNSTLLLIPFISTPLTRFLL